MRVVVIDGQNTTFKNFPKDFEGWEDIETGRKLNNPKWEKGYWVSQGVYEVIEPVILTNEKKGQGGVTKDNIYTYAVINKSDAELKIEKEQKLKAEQEKIKQEKLDKIAEDAINANPLEHPTYWAEWEAGSYAVDAKVNFKGKLFKNTIEGNTNAPDKGGWTEIK